MAMFPLFIDLKDKKCVVVGGGRVAARKARTLAGFGAEITVVSPGFGKEMLELCSAGAVRLCEREYRESDLDGAFLMVAATSDRRVNAGIAGNAKERNIFVNTADDPEQCSFLFPAIAKKGDVVIGITTSGSCPALTKQLRAQIEGLLEQIDTSVLEGLKRSRRTAREEKMRGRGGDL